MPAGSPRPRSAPDPQRRSYSMTSPLVSPTPDWCINRCGHPSHAGTRGTLRYPSSRPGRRGIEGGPRMELGRFQLTWGQRAILDSLDTVGSGSSYFNIKRVVAVPVGHQPADVVE